MMRRSGSNAGGSSHQRSGESTSSTNSGSFTLLTSQPTRRKSSHSNWRHHPLGHKKVIGFLIIIATLLCALDLILLWKRSQRSHSSSSLEELEARVIAQFIKKHEEQQKKLLTPMTKAELDFDKEPIYEILRQAGIYPETLDDETKQQLPTWSKITSLYGDHPIIYGLDTCEEFRAHRDPPLTFYGIAGTFNTGTNLLAELLIQNCQITERMEVYGERQKGMRWQVPWGKHTPARFRTEHVTSTDKDVPVENSLPMITIRDPFSWMQSMCRHTYEAMWEHTADHCPNVYAEKRLGGSGTVPIHVKYKELWQRYKSLPHMWNQWYRDYMNVEYPRIIVRFEDLLFHGKNVTETLCQCGGGVPRRPMFKHISKSAKLGTAAHGKIKTSLVEALIRYGTDEDRLKGMTVQDIQMSNEILDDDLMKLFDYHKVA